MSVAVAGGRKGHPGGCCRMKATLLLAAFLLLPASVFASRESLVPWQSVVIESPELPEAGVVRVEAKVDGEEWKSLAVEVHGRTVTLAPEDLLGLKGFPLVSLRITQESGYQPIGGHTVSLRFERSFAGADGTTKKEFAHLMIPKFGPHKILISPG